MRLQGLDALVFDRGPGAFTGVRIATSVVQGLAFGAELPVLSVCSLAALAQGAYRMDGAERVLATIDARMGEVYWAAYRLREGIMYAEDEVKVSIPADVTTPGTAGFFGVGTGWESYARELLTNPQVNVSEYCGTRYPHAMDLVTLGQALFTERQWCDPASIAPEYVRNDVVRKRSAN